MPSTKPYIKLHLPEAQMQEAAQAAAKRNLSIAELLRQMLIEQGIITDPEMKWGGNKK